jgi:hypothetical protein
MDRYSFSAAEGRMRFRLAAITVFTIGYYLGCGAFGILEFLCGLVWVNPLGEAFHDAILSFDDARLTDFYAAIRTDFRFGIGSVLVGFLGAMILPRRLDILPWFLVSGFVARWVPLTIELIKMFPKVSAAEIVAHIPQFVFDITLIPACMLGTAMGRLVRLRRIPRCRLRSAGILTALLALWLTAGIQGPTWLLPFATCGLIGVLSHWLLIHSNVAVGKSANHAVNPSGGSGPS